MGTCGLMGKVHDDGILMMTYRGNPSEKDIID